MDKLERVARVLVPTTVVGAMLLGSTSLAIPPAKKKWIRIRSNHFEVVSDANRHDAEDVAIQFEHFRAFMEMNEPQRTSDPRITVFLFKNDESFAPYKKSPHGEPYNLIGVFNNTPYGVYIAMRADLGEETFRTVYHEYTHYFLSRKPISIPLWFHEGMAEYLSTFKTNGKKVLLGEPPPVHLEALRQLPWLALGDLFAADVSSPDYNEANRQTLFYAQSWGLLHYMRHARSDLYANLHSLVNALNEGRSTVDAFQRAYGIDYSRFVTGMHDYFTSGNPHYIEVDVSALKVDESLHMEELPYHEALVLLGTYLSDVTPWESKEAKDHLTRALEIAPDHAGAHATLGTVLSQQGKLVDAREHFSRAVDLAPDSDLPLFRFGMSRLLPYMLDHPWVRDLPPELPEELLEPRQLLALALQLNPSRLEAQVACGWTYVFDAEDASQGVRLLQPVHALLPNRMDVMYYLVTLYLRLGQRQSAESLIRQSPFEVRQFAWFAAALQALGRSPTKRPVAAGPSLTADQLVLALDVSRLTVIEATWKRFREAVKAYESGDYDACLAILNELSQAQIDAAVEDQIEILRPMAQEKEASLRQALTYNEAAQKVRDRKYKEAAAMLEKLLKEPIRDPALEKTARDLLNRLPR